MIAIVEDKRSEVAELRDRYGVERLDLFGSASSAGDGFDPEGSDQDFVVSLKRRVPQNLFSRYFDLEEDLVMERALQKNHRFAANVEESRVLLYGT
ncbi:MAG TPA: hypothetical protein VJ827_05030 [Rubrobacter sp.]|nr:hypothetical protein [Rubrobacter sp.]